MSFTLAANRGSRTRDMRKACACSLPCASLSATILCVWNALMMAPIASMGTAGRGAVACPAPSSRMAAASTEVAAYMLPPSVPLADRPIQTDDAKDGAEDNDRQPHAAIQA